MPGSSSDWHTVQNFISIQGKKAQIILGSEEIPLVHFSDINLGKFQYIADIKNNHVYSWVLNNYWVTNFKASQHGELKWSYYLTSTNNSSPVFATQFGWESRIPFVSRVLPSQVSKNNLMSKSLLDISNPDILLVCAKPSADNKSIILQLREIAGKTAELKISEMFSNIKYKSIIEVNVLEEKSENNFSSSIYFKANEVKFIKMEF